MIGLREPSGNARPRATPAKFRLSLTAAVLLALASMLSAAAAFAGDLDRVVAFDIKAQSLDKALLQFGAQADVRISFSCDLSKTKLRTHEIKGDYTGRQALARLLNGTRLRYVSKERTVEILAEAPPCPSPSARAGRSDNPGHRPDPMRSTDPSRQTPDPLLATRHSRSSRSAQTLGEIIVTAQKYRQTAFDVPISLQVLSATQLQQHRITNLSNLQYDVPGLYMNSTGVSQQIFLRGVGNDFGSGAMVGEYIDDADITAESVFGGLGYGPGDNELHDLKRVEVLKGPQGTLYGDGSIGGVIRYITNKPDLARFEMSADDVAMFTRHGAPSQRIGTMLNTPLVKGTLGLRVAGMFAHDGGWVDEPAANLKNINGGNLTDIRAEARWRPSEDFTANAMQIIHRQAYGIGTGEDAQGDITPVFHTTLVPHAVDSSDLSNLDMAYTFSVARLISSSTYLSEYQNIYNVPSSVTIAPRVTYWILESYDNRKDQDFSEELRLASVGGAAWRWTIGAFYKAYRYSLVEDEYFGLGGSSLSAATYLPHIVDAEGSSKSVAEFADTSYRLLDRLTVGAGVRYFRDREAADSAGTRFRPATFTSTDPRVYVQYRVTPDVNTYVSASKGFRSGGFNYLPTLPTYGPETLWSYDLGSKIRLSDGNLLADADAFYSNYSHFVSVTNVPLIGIDLNVGNARIRGVDADLTWRPASDWRVSVNSEILSTEFLTATTASGFAPGERLPYAPKYSFTTSVARTFHWRHRSGDVEVYYYEISRVQYREAGYPLMQSDILRFLNARADLRWTDHLQFGVFLHNILNDRGFESPFGPLFGESARPQPRTLGIQLNATFD